MPGGRPTKYTQELTDIICQRLSEGQSLRTVCKDDDLPCAATVFCWMRTKPEFLEQYEKAKEESADALVEDMLDIADFQADIGNEGTAVGVAHARLRVDTRKWAASKLKPKKYGDKIQAEHSGAVGITFDLDYGIKQKLEISDD